MMSPVFHTRSQALNMLFTGTLALAPGHEAGAQEQPVVDPEHAELHRALLEDLDGMQLDLNRASAPDFEALPWLSRGLIGRIVAHRKHEGPFRRLGQLLEVPGMSPESLEAARPYLRIAPTDRMSSRLQARLSRSGTNPNTWDGLRVYQRTEFQILDLIQGAVLEARRATSVTFSK